MIDDLEREVPEKKSQLNPSHHDVREHHTLIQRPHS
jgi:hypothetical protein